MSGATFIIGAHQRVESFQAVLCGQDINLAVCAESLIVVTQVVCTA